MLFKEEERYNEDNKVDAQRIILMEFQRILDLEHEDIINTGDDNIISRYLELRRDIASYINANNNDNIITHKEMLDLSQRIEAGERLLSALSWPDQYESSSNLSFDGEDPSCLNFCMGVRFEVMDNNDYNVILRLNVLPTFFD